MAKTSPKQAEVLEAMAKGWELACSMGQEGRCWLQEDGIGRGGRTKEVRYATILSLVKKGLIRSGGAGFPNQSYWLAEK